MSITSDHDLSDSVQPVEAERPPASRSRSGVWALVLRLHFYAGVFIAPFLVLAAVTGLAYTFAPQLDQIVYGDKLHVDRVIGQRSPLAEQITAVRAAHPEGTISSVIPPADRDATTAVVLTVPELGDKQRTVYVDPYTGKVKGALTTSSGSTPVTTWLSELHSSLHLGQTGRLYSELAASWLWVIVLGGLVLWLGRRRQYRGRGPIWRALIPKRSDRGVRRTRARHAALGLWLAGGLLFLSATGLTWAEHAGKRFDIVQAKLDSTAPQLDTALSGSASSASNGHTGHNSGTKAGQDGPVRDADKILSAARTAGLSGPVALTPPEDAKSAWSVAQTDNTWPVRKDKIAVDPATGQVTARVNWSDHPTLAKLSSLGIQAHMGRLFGLANQLVLAAIAGGLLIIVLWGYRMWWQRRPTRADRKALVGTPPARGTWRQLPWPVLALGIPTVLAIGWAVPVLGISLLAFLAVDALLGLRTRRTVTR
jgi:uncharacterized iron-regulated membrane protein